MTVINPNEVDWAGQDDVSLAYAAQGGIPQARAELAKREVKARVAALPADARAAMASRIKNGRPGR